VSTEKETGGSAFPVPGLSGLPNGDFLYASCGMDLRDYFAAKAIPGVMQMMSTGAHQPLPGGAKGIAMSAYEIADAMLAARAK
jgi:hypothetical protein